MGGRFTSASHAGHLLVYDLKSYPFLLSILLKSSIVGSMSVEMKKLIEFLPGV